MADLGTTGTQETTSTIRQVSHTPTLRYLKAPTTSDPSTVRALALHTQLQQLRWSLRKQVWHLMPETMSNSGSMAVPIAFGTMLDGIWIMLESE